MTIMCIRDSSGLKPYVCEEDGCQRAYCCRLSLQQHMKRVHLKSLSVLETARYFAHMPFTSH
ncbi:hypothetical protein T4E_4313 [Trichinella pseudospiralis]|uniref:C2H2-type domain-containing protein n=1 Tax=Trichinella pseudospiralis TaxID=6337 RepID=A0A0V0XMA4_TRIPS|nr:hypothetical protein T4E_4313 [Trichinella pseudospiralis]